MKTATDNQKTSTLGKGREIPNHQSPKCLGNPKYFSIAGVDSERQSG